MSSNEDQSKLAKSKYNIIEEKGSLLSKYQIPINHFEFDYIEKCKDGKELEKILRVLRSGEEGYFRDLETATENRLKTIKPKSKLLRSTTQVLNKNDLHKNDLETILTDLNIWVDDVSKDDTELETRRSSRNQQDIAIRTSRKTGICLQDQRGKTEKRISATDYKAWDKYDPDTEILKMQIKEEKEKQEANKKESNKTKNQTRSVTVNEFGTEAETRFLSIREREKGNEYFKIGDFEEALVCYTNSIILKANIDNLNNRAVTYLKVLKYPEAIADCEKVLELDENNLKAHWHAAEALEKIQNYEEALKHVDFVIQYNPNDFQVQKLAERVRKNCTAYSNKVHMQITEIN